MNNPNCGACGMLNSRGFCSLTACRFPVVNELETWQERILANKPKHTNADRIRAMSDEELAEFAAGTGQGCAPGENLVECCFDHKDGPVEEDCRKCWLDWLKEEAASDG